MEKTLALSKLISTKMHFVLRSRTEAQMLGQIDFISNQVINSIISKAHTN
jgi:hypothetical protein